MSDELKLLSPHEFPPLLREMPRGPKQLYVRGTLPSTSYKWLAVVGSRQISPYGKQVCRTLVGDLRGHPVVIVSGLAYGVDAEAHLAALNAGLPTVSVLGSGLDWNLIGPRANLGLAREILKKGGALVSEYPPSMRATVWSFPQRDRIMAGFCHATLLVEAKEKSGTLITAKFTTEFNRELLVVPGSIFSPQSVGVHQFLKLGATPVTTAQDILVALGLSQSARPAELMPELSETETAVWELLASPRSRDELLRDIELPIDEAQAAISLMEIKGILVEELGFLRRA